MTVAQTPYVVDPETVERLDVLGPVVEFLTPATEDDGAPCLLRGTIPPGGIVPLHPHPEPETFVALDGGIEGLVDVADGGTWRSLDPGDVLHVPPDARHAWRNRAGRPGATLLVTRERIARFFREIGAPVGPGRPPSREAIERFLAVADRYGYWNATPEENAAVGLTLPG
jgi:quercetin dioxygenase-like cupin family protein